MCWSWIRASKTRTTRILAATVFSAIFAIAASADEIPDELDDLDVDDSSSSPAIVEIAAPAAEDPPDESDAVDIDGSIRIGVQYLDVDGDEAKFNEYRNVSKDFEFVAEEVMLRGYKDRYHFFVEGLDLDRDDDRSAVFEGGRYNSFQVNLGWDETSHHYANDVPFLGTLQGDNYWAIPDITQLTLEPDFPLGGNPPASPTANGVTNLLDLLNNARKLDLDLVRKTGTVDLSFTPFENFDLLADYLHRDQDGFRPMSTGVYRRDSDGAGLVGGVGENFTLYGLEFPEPIDYDIDEVGGGLNYRADTWNVNLRYRYVSFDNNIGSVTWDNPLRLNGIDNIQYGTALSRLDLAPDSHSHTVTTTGSIRDLPLDSRFTVTASWGRILQDEDFQKYTVNDVLTVLGGPNAGALAEGLGLPANDLDGQVDTIMVNALLSSRPIDPLSLNFRLNYYDYDDESDRISWTDGWARIGESVWSKPAEAGVVNRVPDWERIRPSVDAAYRFNKMLTLLADYTYEAYNRNDDRNADTEEHVVGGKVKLAPTDWSTLRVGYHWADRHIDGSYRSEPAEQFFEWEKLRMFDQSDRTRNSVDAYLTLDPIERLSLGFSFHYKHDKYDTDYYGLQKRDGYVFGVDAGYEICEGVSVFAYYTRDDYDTKTKTRTKSDSSGGGSFEVPENDWLTRINDTTNTIGGAVSISLIPEKLSLEVSADYSFGESDFDTSNINFDALETTSSATAFDWSDTEIKTTQVRADLEYKWTDRLNTSLRYMFQRYRLDDAFTDSVVPYGNPDDAQGNSLDYFIFLDANYSDYTAHLITMTVSYEF